eukprot:NODE_21117_length_768_cov_3.188768.p3 GENE.NODE_21117_length_768_cov_3.188768~~NODE_21117_length_768_cov_3.188768.p3  ORF type:complete len:131 (+),score=19.18 NODE_21117_length_768_cov_3.188768:342-734(+)
MPQPSIGPMPADIGAGTGAGGACGVSTLVSFVEHWADHCCDTAFHHTRQLWRQVLESRTAVRHGGSGGGGSSYHDHGGGGGPISAPLMPPALGRPLPARAEASLVRLPQRSFGTRVPFGVAGGHWAWRQW